MKTIGLIGGMRWESSSAAAQGRERAGADLILLCTNKLLLALRRQ